MDDAGKAVRLGLFCGKTIFDAFVKALGELGAAMGVQGPVDVALANAVRAQSLQVLFDNLPISFL